MTKRRFYGLTLCLAAAMAFAVFFTPRSTPAHPGEPKLQGQEAPGNGPRAQEFIKAFNAGDAKAVAAFWTPEGVYIDQVGREFKGRDALEKLYKGVFAENKGAKLTIHVTSLRTVSPDVAIEEGLTEVAPANGDPPSAAKFLAVLVKKNDVWYFESVQDSIARPPSNAEHFAGLSWLIGDWTGESDKGQSARFSFAWAENQNFIVSSFAITVNGIPVTGGHQWLAWDAADQKIRSWSFFSGGGFGEGAWTQEGNKWIVRTAGKAPTGKKVSLTSEIVMVDGDHFTWQVTELSIDGKTLPAGTVTKLKRVKAERP